jgi:hypothetical protein
MFVYLSKSFLKIVLIGFVRVALPRFVVFVTAPWGALPAARRHKGVCFPICQRGIPNRSSSSLRLSKARRTSNGQRAEHDDVRGS